MLMKPMDSVITLDTGYVTNGLAACYLILEESGCAIVETGTTLNRELILDALKSRGFGPERVRYIFVTHVHLDHAGGAGALMESCPGATLVVHPKGARHLIDPSRLEESSRQVYGDERFERLYGSVIPVPADRLVEGADGQEFPMGNRTIRFLHTPGHATHHGVFFDTLTGGVFTGDAFGLAYPPMQHGDDFFIFPAATPVRFDGEGFLKSMERILSLNPEVLFLTNYGPFLDPVGLGRALEREVRLYMDWISQATADLSLGTMEEVERWLHEKIVEHSRGLYETLGNAWSDPLWKHVEQDMELNAQGLAFTVMGDRKAKEG